MFIIFFEYVVAKNCVIEVFIFFFEFSIIIILTLSLIFVISKWAFKKFRVPFCNPLLVRTVHQINLIENALKSRGVRLSDARNYVSQKATHRVENAISSFFSTFFMAKMRNQFWNRTVREYIFIFKIVKDP